MHEVTGQTVSSSSAGKKFMIADEVMARFAATISSDEVKIVSFDIFDTLLTRCFFKPKDVFSYIANDPGVLVELGDWDFASARSEAETSVRLRLKDEGKLLDPTLDDIYMELAHLSDVSYATAEKLKQLEIKTEIACVRPRLAATQLYDLALRLGKPVILVTDMYLPTWVIERMLSAIGCDGPHTMFHSAESGYTKKHGTIFPYIAQQLKTNPDAFLHFGDNRNSDIRQAEKAGWKALQLQDYRSILKNPDGMPLSGLLPDYSTGQEPQSGPTGLNYALMMERSFGNSLKAISPTKKSMSAKDFGYIGVGPFVLSLVLWVRRLSREKRIKKIAWLARDGHLLHKVAQRVDDAAGAASQSIYLPISRRMLIPYLVHQRDGLDRILGVGFSPEMTVMQFVETRFGPEALAIIKNSLNDDAERFLFCSMRDQYHHVVRLLKERVDELREANKNSYARLVDFYRQHLDGEADKAIFDVGRKGTFQSALSNMIGHRVHGFYAVNSYAIQRNAPGRSYDSFLGIIDHRVRSKNPDTVIYEALLSESGGSYLGLDANGELIRADKKMNADEEQFFSELHTGALEFADDAIAMHGARVVELEQEPFYASYALENWQDSVAATQLLSSVRHEDSMSTVTPRTLTDYLIGKPAANNAAQFAPKADKRRRIAIYCPAMTRIRGGAERIAARLANHLHRHGYEVLVYSSGRPEASIEPVYDLQPGIHVRNVDTGNIDQMVSMIGEFDPDAALVLASGSVVLRVSKALLHCGVPYMLSERAAPEASMSIYWRDHSTENYFAAYECASAISVQCNGFRDAFPQRMRERVLVLPNPIEMVEVGNVDRENTVLCAARIWFEQKQQDVLLRAFAQVSDKHPEWRLKFFGEPYGKDATTLEALATDLGISKRVEIRPATPQIAKEFKKSGVFVLPSAFEGFPNSLAEALAHGMPAIGFQSCPGVNELILDGKNGILVDDTDLIEIAKSTQIKAAGFAKDQMASRMADALGTMMDSRSKRADASAKAIELIQQYDAARVLKTWEREVESLCTQDGSMFAQQRLAAVDALLTKPRTDSGSEPSFEPGPEAESSDVINAKAQPSLSEQAAYNHEREIAVRQILDGSLRLRLQQSLRLIRGQDLMTDWELFDAQLKPNGLVELAVPSSFDETAYLAENVDVKEAVANGDFQSGYAHFLRHGFLEGRRRANRS
ncbi:MAG: glycosyltransferase [Pseudomonadota bacterium]